MVQIRPSILTQPDPDPRESTTPALPEPATAEEYYPGYSQQVSRLGVEQFQAHKRLVGVNQQLNSANRQANNVFRKLLGFGPQLPVYAVGKLDLPGMRLPSEQELEVMRAEAAAAANQVKSIEWRLEVLQLLPGYLSSTTFSVMKPEDVLTFISHDQPSNSDMDWLGRTFEDMKFMTNILPENYRGDIAEVQALMLEEVLTEPPLELRAVHNLTVEELGRTFQVQVGQLPEGMTSADARALLKEIADQDDEREKVDSWLREKSAAWAVEIDRINLLKAGLVLPEEPSLTPLQFGTLLLVQPMMATVETLDKYFNMLPRPLAATSMVWLNKQFRSEDSEKTTELEKLHAFYTSMGEGGWASYAQAFNEWDAPWWQKMLIEAAFDPTSYLGFGLAGHAATKFGTGLTKLGMHRIGTRIGPLVSTFENGYAAGADTVFKAGLQVALSPVKGAFWLTGAGYTIPQTYSVMSRSFARQTMMDLRAVIQRQNPGAKSLEGFTADQIKDGLETTVRAGVDNPLEGTDLQVRLAANLMEFPYATDETARALLKGVYTPTSPVVSTAAHIGPAKPIQNTLDELNRLNVEANAERALARQKAVDEGFLTSDAMVDPIMAEGFSKDIPIIMGKLVRGQELTPDELFVWSKYKTSLADPIAKVQQIRKQQIDLVEEAAPILKDVDVAEVFTTAQLAKLNTDLVDYFSGVYGPRATAGNILGHLQKKFKTVAEQEAAVKKLAVSLNDLKERTAKRTIDAARGTNPKEVFINLFEHIESTRYSNLTSPITSHMQQAGRAASWHSRYVDNVLTWSKLVALERKFVQPFARWQLLFFAFGPFNFLENMQRSVLGGAEILYPRAYGGLSETNRLFSGLSNAPYELVLFERGENRLTEAVVDRATGQTTAFQDGLIPFVTRDVTLPSWMPFLGGKRLGKTINIAGRDHFLGSLQSHYDFFASLNSRQVAWDYQIHYLKALAEDAPEDFNSILEVLTRHRGELPEFIFSRSDIKDIERVKLLEALTSAESVRNGATLDIFELQRRLISKDIGKVMNKATEVSPETKNRATESVLNGSMFQRGKESIAEHKFQAIANERERSIISLSSHIDKLKELAEAYTTAPPSNILEFMSDLDSITAMADASFGQLRYYRQITAIRRQQLSRSEREMFDIGSAKQMDSFLQTIDEEFEKLYQQIRDFAEADLDIPSIAIFERVATAQDVALNEEKIQQMMKRDAVSEDAARRWVGIVDVGDVIIDFVGAGRLHLKDELEALGRTVPVGKGGGRGRLTLTGLVERWFSGYDNANLQLLGKTAQNSESYLAGIRSILNERYPAGYIRIFRGGGAAKREGYEPLEREFVNVTSSKYTAKVFENNWTTDSLGIPTPLKFTEVVPDIDDVLIRVDDVLAIGSVDESELIIPSAVLLDRMRNPIKASLLNEKQLQAMDTLSLASRKRRSMISEVRTRNSEIDAKYIKAPKGRGKQEARASFYDKQSADKSASWDTYFSAIGFVEAAEMMARHNFLDSVGQSTFVPDFVPEVVRDLTPDHLAYLFGVTGDDLYRGLTNVNNFISIVPKEDFIASVSLRANIYANKSGKTAAEIGFTNDKIGDIYDQMWRTLGIEPSTLTPDSPTVMQIEEIYQEIERLYMTTKISETDAIQFRRYVNAVADDIEKLPMYNVETIELAAAPGFFRYIGGKTELATKILPEIGRVKGNFIDPFFGSGAIPFSLMRSNAIGGRVIAQEADPHLISLYKVAAERPDELIDEVKRLYGGEGGVIDKDKANQIRALFNRTESRKSEDMIFHGIDSASNLGSIIEHGLNLGTHVSDIRGQASGMPIVLAYNRPHTLAPEVSYRPGDYVSGVDEFKDLQAVYFVPDDWGPAIRDQATVEAELSKVLKVIEEDFDIPGEVFVRMVTPQQRLVGKAGIGSELAENVGSRAVDLMDELDKSVFGSQFGGSAQILEEIQSAVGDIPVYKGIRNDDGYLLFDEAELISGVVAPVGVGSELERAAMLIILQRHAFMGRIQYNAKGEVISTMREIGTGFSGKYTSPFNKSLTESARQLSNISVTKATKDSYIDSIRQAGVDDVVYLDPPYTQRQFQYGGEVDVGPWTIADRDIMLMEAKAASARGARVVLSESLAAEDVIKAAGFEVKTVTPKRGRGGQPGGDPPSELLATMGHKPEPLTIAEGMEDWWTVKEGAMSKARERHDLSYPTYHDSNMIEEGGRAVFPFMNYELFRWRWIPRTWMRTPGTMTNLARWTEYSDEGYIPIPFTDLQLNPLRGSIWMGGLRSMFLKDFPEYYDAMPGMEMIDYIGRAGFYPGIHIMAPIVMYGAKEGGKPEWSEVTPNFAQSGLSALRALSPVHIGRVIDFIYPDRFRDFQTMLTLGERGYDADEIWRKKKEGISLSPEEEKLWLHAENAANGVKGILMQQTGLFRLRPQEYDEIRKSLRLAIEEAIGVPVAIQERIDRLYPTTGKRLSDYYRLDILQQKLLYEWDTYRRWQGVSASLFPSGWQQLDRKIDDYFETLEKVFHQARRTNKYDDEGNIERPSMEELTRQWVAREIGPEQWISMRANIQSGLAEAIDVLGNSPAYADVPKTLEEREELYKSRGIVTPTYGPDQELLWYYYELKPKYKWDWDAGRHTYDYETYYSQIDILLESLNNSQRERLIERIQFDWNPMDRLYWNISREYFRPYRNIRSIVLNQYGPEQVKQIRRFETARGSDREALQEVIGPDGDKLISGFDRRVRDARQQLRLIDTTLDAWLVFFGKTDKALTTEADEEFRQFEIQFLTVDMIQ